MNGKRRREVMEYTKERLKGQWRTRGEGAEVTERKRIREGER